MTKSYGPFVFQASIVVSNYFSGKHKKKPAKVYHETGMGGEPPKHSGPHRLHNIFSGPHLLFKFLFKNVQFYFAGLLNIHGELFFIVKCRTLARFFFFFLSQM